MRGAPFGKTVAAFYLIAVRNRNTLALIHREQLLAQWRERLAAFLELSIDRIGQISGTKSKRTGGDRRRSPPEPSSKGSNEDLVARPIRAVGKPQLGGAAFVMSCPKRSRDEIHYAT